MKNRIPATLRGQTLLHISPRSNRESIQRNGLTINNDPSGYGEAPTMKALYFYHEDNINLLYDAVTIWEEFDVWEVRNLLGLHARPDEDAVNYKKVKTWRNSLQQFGTVAYVSPVPAKDLNLLMAVTRPD